MLHNWKKANVDSCRAGGQPRGSADRGDTYDEAAVEADVGGVVHETQGGEELVDVREDLGEGEGVDEADGAAHEHEIAG